MLIAGDVTTQFVACGMQTASIWWYIFIVPKGAMLAFGAWLAYKVRHLNHNFNEAKYISLALYNVIVLSAMLLGLILAFPGAADTTYALKTIGMSLRRNCFFSVFCVHHLSLVLDYE